MAETVLDNRPWQEGDAMLRITTIAGSQACSLGGLVLTRVLCYLLPTFCTRLALKLVPGAALGRRRLRHGQLPHRDFSQRAGLRGQKACACANALQGSLLCISPRDVRTLTFFANSWVFRI